jgi:menaquinone-specific isochorismate synthase
MTPALGESALELPPPRLSAFIDGLPRVPAEDVVVFTVPAPLAPLEVWAKTAGDQNCFVWEPARSDAALEDTSAWVGLGETRVLEATGPQRFAQLKAQASALSQRIHGASGEAAPRFFGGFAFAPGQGQTAAWRELGDARFVLPRLAYRREGQRAFLQVAVGGEELASAVARRALADEIAAKLARSSEPPRPVVALRVLAEQRTDGAAFRARVEVLRERIAQGDVQKVVTACQAELELTEVPSLAALVVALGTDPLATRFAFRSAELTFCGASPERLVSRSGLRVATEAVAGSAPRARVGTPSELLERTKDRAEHAFVVDALLNALGPITSELQRPEQPKLRELERVVHLLTPIAGRLARELHVLELVELLHPTPAVGGTPRDRALALIDAIEPAPRGWYASPVGWFDLRGHGSFAVAIRSGLLRGNKAMLHAGAGIVAASEPAAELAEIELKLSTLRSALGVADRTRGPGVEE